MSHASCLVVTDFEPDENTLAPILQPWHEFECTGIARWDWWQVGGRYSGRLRAGTKGTCNSAMRADLDLAAMKAARVAERHAWASECCTRAKRTMADMSVALAVADASRAAWRALPEPKPRGGEYHDWLAARGHNEALLADFSRANFSLPELAPGETLSNWLANPPALETWAMVLNGEWHEGARLLMFGAHDGDRTDWSQRFAALFGQIRADQWLTVVDYHI